MSAANDEQNTEVNASENVTPSKDERLYAMLAHILAFCGFIAPLASIIAPLVLWLVKRNDSAFVDRHGKESVNFQISIAIYALASVLLCIIFIGYLLLLGLVVFNIVVVIIASIRANDGLEYRYPLNLRLIK